MSIVLAGKYVACEGSLAGEPHALLRLVASADEVRGDADAVLLRNGASATAPARYVLVAPGTPPISPLPPGASLLSLPAVFSYLQAGDILRVTPARGRVRTLFRTESRHNHFLVTEQCNHYCLMCSQPPIAVDDSWLVRELQEVIPLIPQSTAQVGFTGGEPTLLGDDFLAVLRACGAHLPRTAVQVLTNGRRFAHEGFVQQWAELRHPALSAAIPLYADVASVHDYVVQAGGAFAETVRGILKLKQHRQRVEIRVVLHKVTVARLERLAEFIIRNLLFVDHVALMGLEITGFTRANLSELWVDPYDYRDELAAAVGLLSNAGMRVSVYNHALCLLTPDVRPFAVQSISDWKNDYLPVCEKCEARRLCGGFFTSAVHRHSAHIAPLSLR